MRDLVQRYIGQHRQSRLVRSAYRVSRLITDAYDNRSLDAEANGEYALLAQLAPAAFHVALDVGANVGDWTTAALNAWPQAHVHAVEVAPQTHRDQVANLARAGLSRRATSCPFGLGETKGTLEMYYFPGASELTCDMARHEGRPVTTFEAEIRTGDAYLSETELSNVDFVKIDVEGAEHRVLAGFAKAVADQRLACIQFEYGAFATQTRVLLKDFYTRLAAQYWIGKIYPASVDFRDYDWTIEGFAFANFLCVSRQRPDLKALAEA